MSKQAQVQLAFAAAQRDGVVFADMTLRRSAKNWVVSDCNYKIVGMFSYAAGVQAWLQRCAARGYQVAATKEESYRRSAPVAVADNGQRVLIAGVAVNA